MKGTFRTVGLAVLFLGATASAKVLYVNQNATGTEHDGASWATAYVSVGNALQVAGSGDEVWVAKGTYTEAYFNIPGGVSLYGGFAGGEAERGQRDWKANTTVLDGTGSTNQSLVYCSYPNIVVDGFTVSHIQFGVFVTDTATLANNVITATTSDSVYVYQGKATLVNNTIKDNKHIGVYVNAGATAALIGNTVSNCGYCGVLTAGTANLTNNTICANGAFGAYVFQGTAALTNNTVSGNSSYGVYVFNSTADLSNNIVAHNPSYGVYMDTSGAIASFSHNDVSSNPSANYYGYTPPADQGNISLDPLFVDRTSGDFHLTSGSPCIDAGDDSAVTSGGTDRDGRPRLFGAHVDIGAYEFGPPPFTWPDVRKALGIAGGLIGASSDDVAHVDVEGADRLIDLCDALRIARKVAGLEPNP